MRAVSVLYAKNYANNGDGGRQGELAALTRHFPIFAGGLAELMETRFVISNLTSGG
jgi:hypothetical protein